MPEVWFLGLLISGPGGDEPCCLALCPVAGIASQLAAPFLYHDLTAGSGSGPCRAQAPAVTEAPAHGARSPGAVWQAADYSRGKGWLLGSVGTTGTLHARVPRPTLGPRRNAHHAACRTLRGEDLLSTCAGALRGKLQAPGAVGLVPPAQTLPGAHGRRCTTPSRGKPMPVTAGCRSHGSWSLPTEG